MKNLLIISNDEGYAKQLSNRLSNIFIEIYTSKNFSESEILISDNDIDFIITTFTVNNESAIEFCVKIRKNEKFLKTQITIIDEKFSKTNKQKSLKSGAIYYFVKENAFDELPEAIMNISNMTNLIHQGGETFLLYEPDLLRQNIVKSLLSFANISVNAFDSTDKAQSFINTNIIDIDIFLIYCKKINNVSSFIENIRKHKHYANSPIIILTEEMSPPTKYKLFLLGITDFMIMPFDVCDFYLKLKTHLKLNYVMGMLEAKNKLLTIKTTTDELTGLFNRRFFWEMLKKEVSRSKRQSSPFSILMVDIDDFKSINDTYGHMVGDEVLQKIAISLREELRQSDTIARFGGEEFIILLPDTNSNQASIVANKIRNKIASTKFKNIKEQITISIGIADSSEDKDYESLICLSDTRLYKAKNTGKNKVIND